MRSVFAALAGAQWSHPIDLAGPRGDLDLSLVSWKISRAEISAG